MHAYHKTDILYFANSHIDAFLFVHRETNVDKVEFVSNGSNLHEGKYITIIEPTFMLWNLLEPSGRRCN